MNEFILKLLKEAGLPGDTEQAVIDQLVKDLGERADQLANRRLIESLSDEDAATFEKLIDEQPENITAMQQFINEHVQDHQQVVSNALLEFRALYLGDTA